MAEVWIGEPWRHFSFGYGESNFMRAGADIVIGNEGHRRNSGGAMAALAVLLKNWENVAIENGRRNIAILFLDFCYAGFCSSKNHQNNCGCKD
jgi:hypothetical protein